MSNPIADTVDYFARLKQNNSRISKDRPDEDTRHQSIDQRTYTSTTEINNDSNVSDARSQWMRVLNRISFMNPMESTYTEENHDISDDDSYVDRDTFELMRSTIKENKNRVSHDNDASAIIIDDNNEEKLPSVYELENDDIYPLRDENIDKSSNYFVHPFPEQPVTTATAPPTIISSTTSTSQHPEEIEEGRVKDKWDRTFNKLKLIANIQPSAPVTVTAKPSILHAGPSHTLATYYPPAFDPLFASLARDEYDRKLPPILLQCIYVTVTDSEYLHGSSQWAFRVELQYGDVKWVIRRGIAEFMALHIKLKVKSNLYDYVPDPPVFPNQLANLLDSARSTIGIYREDTEPQQRSDDNSSYKSNNVAFQRRQALTQYLRALLLKAHATVSYDICEFLELSAISIAHDMGWKGKEGYLRNRINYVQPRCCQVWKTKRWSTEWIILRDSYMAFCTDTASSEPTDVLLFDNNLKIEIKEPRVYLGSYHIFISNDSRRIEIKGTKREVDQWLESIEKVRIESPWVKNHRFGSFSPVRRNAKVKWFVDAENHFNAVAEAILSAKTEIYIAGWWLTPELDRLLNRKASEGVKIYIIVYKEMSSCSGHTMSRYDTHAHSLADHPAEGHDKEVFKGQDYSNPRVKDFSDVARFDKTLIDRATTARMPWHDVTMGVVGPIARDVSRHFIQRWNFLKSNKSMHRRNLPFLMPKGEYVAARDESSFSGTCNVQLLRSSSRWSSDVEREHSIYNAYMECIAHSKHFVYIENQFFISTTQDDKLLRNKIAQALLERIIKAHKSGQKYRAYIMMPLIPAFEGDLTSTEASAARNVMHFQYLAISRGGNSIIEKLKEQGIDPDKYISWFSLRNYGKIKIPKTPLGTDSLSAHPVSSRRGSAQSNGSNVSDDDRYHYVSELLYIHDKLMIVDDRIVLMGSANINDRSMLGNRDSEIAMIVEDTEMITSYMDGKEYQASKFAHTLRMQLWKEHLGLLTFDKWSKLWKMEAEKDSTTMEVPQSLKTPIYPRLARSSNNAEEIKTIVEDGPAKMLDRASRTYSFYDTYKTHHHPKRHDAAVMDPLSDRFYNELWVKTAETNTKIYRELFRCVPDDTIHTYEQHRRFVPDAHKVKYGHIADPNLNEEEIVDQIDKIRGHLVVFPKDYLKDENLLNGTIIDSVTPLIIFT
ncbi:hypothetical protein BDB01DRAFT_731756 [Pilobolus umbonatus]|nr:hypothetical protein BDB01DRAFT_731756 [Pilobolus umbonatus]